jgi:acyl-CoA dehydrogenase
MDLTFSPEERAFQAEVREFIDSNLPAADRRAQKLTPSVFCEPDVARAYQRALYKRGWSAPAWPVEYGGTDWTPAQRYIFELESARAGVPAYAPLGTKMVGPVIFTFGTQAQKDKYLPRIVSGEDYWCQGYSEPGSGSDLASLRTKAVRDGDSYVINGTKIWTTHAHHANRMFALVRTSQAERKQDGISFVLIDMETPGISVRPILTIGGDHEVNQVFFDDVRIPAENVVGQEGKGWTYGKFLLEFERGAGAAAPKLRQAVVDTLKLIEDADEDERASLRLRASEIEIDIDALETMELKLLSSLQAGQTPGAVSSMLKLRVSEIKQAVTRLGLEAIGRDSLVWEGRRPLYSLNEPSALPEDRLAVLPAYLDGRAFTIFGGTSEVQRDLIARTVIGA